LNQKYHHSIGINKLLIKIINIANSRQARPPLVMWAARGQHTQSAAALSLRNFVLSRSYRAPDPTENDPLLQGLLFHFTTRYYESAW